MPRAGSVYSRHPSPPRRAEPWTWLQFVPYACPDLSIRYGTPNTCNDCHVDKSPAWAAAAIEGWHGSRRKGFQKFGAALHAAWTGEKDAVSLLAEVAADGQTPAIARASALTELGSRPGNIDL